MNKKILFFLLILLVFGITQQAMATLINIDDGIVYDNVAQQYWQSDLNPTNGMTYDENQAYIEQLQTNTGDDWRMARLDDMSNLWSYSAEEILSTFVTNYVKTRDSGVTLYAVTGRYDDAKWCEPTSEWGHNVIDARINTYDNGDPETYVKLPLVDFYGTQDWVGHAAWIVTDTLGDSTAPVPEPATFFLLGCGLIGLVGVRRTKKQ